MNICVWKKMIGRLTAVDPEPKRNVGMELSTEEVSCEISEPPGSIKCKNVIKFEINKLRLGPTIVATNLTIAIVVVLLASTTESIFAMSSALCLLIVSGVLAWRHRKLELTSIYLITNQPITTRIRFYRSFSQFDILLLLDQLTFWIGDKPRIIT